MVKKRTIDYYTEIREEYEWLRARRASTQKQRRRRRKKNVKEKRREWKNRNKMENIGVRIAARVNNIRTYSCIYMSCVFTASNDESIKKKYIYLYYTFLLYISFFFYHIELCLCEYTLQCVLRIASTFCKNVFRFYFFLLSFHFIFPVENGDDDGDEGKSID